MRSRILTKRETLIIEEFLKSNSKLDRVLKMRIKRNFEKLKKDFELIKNVYERFA